MFYTNKKYICVNELDERIGIDMRYIESKLVEQYDNKMNMNTNDKANECDFNDVFHLIDDKLTTSNSLAKG